MSKQHKALKRLALKLISLPVFELMDDKHYLKLRYFWTTGKKLCLDHPIGFSEKIQWLKLNNKDNRLPALVDKLKAKDYVASNIGAQYTAKLICTWDSPAEINANQLSSKCVMKCNHDSGSTIIFEQGKTSEEYVKKFYQKRIGKNYYYSGREWPYKEIKPKVFAEEILPISGDAYDLKFFCFSGEPKVAIRYGASGRKEMSYYDMNWEKYKCWQSKNPNNPDFPKPDNFELITEKAKLLAKDFPFVRVDFIVDHTNFWFSEITFFPSSGFSPIYPEEMEELFGSWIVIN